MLLNILHAQDSPPTKNCQAQHADRTEVEKSCPRGYALLGPHQTLPLTVILCWEFPSSGKSQKCYFPDTGFTENSVSLWPAHGWGSVSCFGPRSAQLPHPLSPRGWTQSHQGGQISCIPRRLDGRKPWAEPSWELYLLLMVINYYYYHAPLPLLLLVKMVDAAGGSTTCKYRQFSFWAKEKATWREYFCACLFCIFNQTGGGDLFCVWFSYFSFVKFL